MGTRFAVAAVFMWLGMVLAISFLEAPLKFRAPGVTLGIGLGIGRLVSRALNTCEYVLAVVIAFALFSHETPAALNVALVLVAAALLAQTLVVRPLLARRTTEVLEGDERRRLRAHFAYSALDFVKVVGLIWTGIRLIGM